MNKPLLLESLPPVKPENKVHLERYVKFINSRPQRDLKREKDFNIHHVYPKSMAVKNGVEDFHGDWNLIKLTLREHYIAHLILFYCGYKEMTFAFSMFKDKDSIVYKKFQQKHNKILQKFVWITDGKNSKRILIENIKNYDAATWSRGRTATEELKVKMSKVGKKYATSRWMNNGVDCVFAQEFEIESFLEKGYVFGRLNQKPTTKNYVIINNGLLQKTVSKETANSFIDNGWTLGVKDDNIIRNFTIVNKNKKSKRIDQSELDHYINNGWSYGYYKDLNKDHHSSKGYKQMYKDSCQKHVKSEDVIYYLSQGWILGILPEVLKKRKGTTGKIVYNNGKNLIKLDPGVIPPQGFVLGSIRTNKGKIYITNGINNKAVLPTDSIPVGWRKGQTKRASNKH